MPSHKSLLLLLELDDELEEDELEPLELDDKLLFELDELLLELLGHSSHTSHSSLTVTPQGQSSALKSHGQQFPSPFLHNPSGQSPLELLELDDMLDKLSDDELELLELVDEDELAVLELKLELEELDEPLLELLLELVLEDELLLEHSSHV